MSMSVAQAQSDGNVSPDSFPIRTGMMAPNFNLDIISPPKKDSSVRLRDVVGPRAKNPPDLVVVNFFALWCKPCKEEMPILERIQASLGPDRVRVYSILVEGSDEGTGKDVVERVRQYATRHKLRIPILRDPYFRDAVPRRYIGDALALPAVFIIGPDGKVLRVLSGKKDYLDKIVRTHLRQ
ncbi:MAG: TlpA family protein disulfide reductase [Deltaproteobacteria bacterium]|nr:TlpA family protein disulfide reductase [Deltaproteobacteria bacterium]